MRSTEARGLLEDVILEYANEYGKWDSDRNVFWGEVEKAIDKFEEVIRNEQD